MRLVVVRCGGIDANRLALARVGPEIFAEAILVVLDDGVGGIENIALRTIILLKFDDITDGEFALEFAHVGRFGTAKTVDRLVIVAHCEDRVFTTGQ